MTTDTTWPCRVCGDERPDAKIGTCTLALSRPDGVAARASVTFCLDREPCRLAAVVKVIEALGLGES